MKIKTLILVFSILGICEPSFAGGSFQAPLTTSPCKEVSANASTTASLALAAPALGSIRGFLQIHNPAAFGGTSISFTLDGSTPVIGGNGFTVPPQATYTYDVWVPTGPVNVIGSSASSPYTICAG